MCVFVYGSVSVAEMQEYVLTDETQLCVLLAAGQQIDVEPEHDGDYGDISEARKDHGTTEQGHDEAGHSHHSTLQQDSPAFLSACPFDPEDDCSSPSSASSGTSSSSFSDNPASSDSKTTRSSSSLLSDSPALDSTAEEHAEAAVSDGKAQSLQPDMSSAADVDTSGSDMQTDMQPGLPVCAEASSALQPDTSPAREDQQTSMPYHDDFMAQLEEEAAAAHARYAVAQLELEAAAAHVRDAVAQLEEEAAAAHARYAVVLFTEYCECNLYCVVITLGKADIPSHTRARHTLLI